MEAERSDSEEFLTYGQRLDRDHQWAWDEGDRYFQRENSTFRSLFKIVGDLKKLGIPYAIAGTLPMFAHGYRRLTEKVVVLVTRDGLKTIHANFKGHGYVAPFLGSKHLCDAATGVQIRFLVTGEYPGDGQPKPVAFPDPSQVAVELDGIAYLSVPKLVELKLASGMTGGVHRLKDLAAVVALIETLELPENFTDLLDPYVRPRFVEFRNAVKNAPPGPDAG